MGRRGRGELYELLRRLVALRERFRGYRIVVLDRSLASGVRRLSVSEVERVERASLLLSDGTVIPLHRVLAVEDGEGREVWSRWSGGRRASSGA